MIRYWHADNLGGYQMKSRDYFISKNEIVKTLQKPEIKEIGRKCSTHIFVDL